MRNVANRTKDAYFAMCHSHLQYLRDVFSLTIFQYLHCLCAFFFFLWVWVEVDVVNGCGGGVGGGGILIGMVSK